MPCLLLSSTTPHVSYVCLDKAQDMLACVSQVDVVSLRYAFAPLRWVGMNAMLVYVMAAEGVFEGFLNGWYYESTNNTLVNGTEATVRAC